MVQALRLTLSAHDELAVLLGQGDDGQRVEFGAGATEAEARRAWDAVHAARYDELAEWLPELLVAVERTAHRAEGQVRQAAFRLLAELQQAVSAMLAKLGAADLAWVAAERSIFAAEQAGEALLAAAGNFRLAHAFLPSGRVDQAAHVVKVTTTALTPHVGPDAPPEVVSIWGAMHLAGSIAATRQNRLDAATRHIREAERAARWLGEDRNDFDTEFGPTNVALHAVAVDVELGNAGDALRRAATVDASGLSAERRARFLIDVARAYGQRRRTQEAVATLLEAEHLTPEQVRSHGLVRETVRDLLRGERYRVDSELRGLARRVGVLP